MLGSYPIEPNGQVTRVIDQTYTLAVLSIGHRQAKPWLAIFRSYEPIVWIIQEVQLFVFSFLIWYFIPYARGDPRGNQRRATGGLFSKIVTELFGLMCSQGVNQRCPQKKSHTWPGQFSWYHLREFLAIWLVSVVIFVACTQGMILQVLFFEPPPIILSSYRDLEWRSDMTLLCHDMTVACRMVREGTFKPINHQMVTIYVSHCFSEVGMEVLIFLIDQSLRKISRE